MKKGIILTLTIAGFAGFAVWQFDFAHQGGAGETQPTTVVNQIDDAKIETNRGFLDQNKKVVLAAKLNSDEALDSENNESNNLDGNMKKYVASAKPEKIMEYYSKLRQARAELVQNKFNAEQPDPKWTSEMAERFKVANTLIPGLPTFNISKSDCRETICALQLDMDKAGYKQYAPYMKHIGTVLGQDTWVHHDAKPGSAVIYLARAEQTLPELELETTH